MEIKEVRIGQPQQSHKIVKKSVRRAREFLSKHEIDFEQLSKEQQDCLVRHIQGLKGTKVVIILCLLSAIIWVGLGIWGLKLFYQIPELFTPTHVTVTDDQGNEQCVQIAPKDSDFIRSYGLMCAIAGGTIAIIAYSAASASAMAISAFIDNRHKRRFLNALLPAFKAQEQLKNIYAQKTKVNDDQTA
jgi:hypothetical protein